MRTTGDEPSLGRALDGGGTLYCAAYTGLGDALLLGPLLQELCIRYPGRVLYPENPVLHFYRRLGIPGLCELRGVDPKHRRFLAPLGPALLEFLAANRVRAVLNFRRDAAQHTDAYLSGSAALEAHGIHLRDICSLTRPSHHQSTHVIDLACEFLSAAGISVERPEPGWLRHTSPLLRSGAQAWSAVLLYTGAGQAHKRLEPRFWTTVAADIQERTGSRLIILPGVTDEERREGGALSAALSAAGVAHRLLVTSDLLEIAIAIARCSVVVSCDTFVVHLSSALDVPLVGLYPATSATMYGPYHRRSATISSPYYLRCPARNATMGNCDAWELGCADTPCHGGIAPHEVVAAVDRLARDAGVGRSGLTEGFAPC